MKRTISPNARNTLVLVLIFSVVILIFTACGTNYGYNRGYHHTSRGACDFNYNGPAGQHSPLHNLYP